MAERLTPGACKGTDTGTVLGSAFTRTLREAQAGDEQAFTRLWRDANPAMVRYLRVIGADAATGHRNGVDRSHQRRVV